MVSWWCSGQVAVPWTWAPQPYIGIWLVMLGLAWGYARLVRAEARRTGTPVDRNRVAAFVGGWATLWIATDWPLGALAAGYLLSASMIQIVVYLYVASPLLVYSVPVAVRERWLRAPGARPLRWVVGRPFVAWVLLQAVLVVTHLPAVADPLKALQVGTMLMDGIWFASALLFWWALDAYRPASTGLRYGKQALYVLASKLVPMALGVYLTFDNFPLFTTYEFANRVWPSVDALHDQQAAGLIMWMAMTPVLLIRLAIVFQAWSRAEAPTDDPLPVRAGVAAPGAHDE